MKRLASLLFVIALALCFATTAFAQDPAGVTQPSLQTTFAIKTTKLDWRLAPYVVGSITTAPGASGQNYTVGGGLEHDGAHWYFDGNGVYSTAAVTANPGQPHVGVFTLQGYYKIGGHLLAGGGATAVLNTGAIRSGQFLNYAKAQANPFVGTGLEFGRFRAIVSYQIPVRGEGVPEQIKFSVNNELALTRHIRVGVPLTISSYQTGPFLSLGGHRVTVTQVGAQIKLVL